MYFNKYYDVYKYPIYTLSDDEDKYIRRSYFGGRNEIFQFGEITDENKFYYYDFTSLYPAMMLKSLPYDEPEYIKGDNIYIKNNELYYKVIDKELCVLEHKFFGFIKCQVTTLNKNVKPLHAHYENNKLCFRYLDDDELTLFNHEINKSLKLGLYKYEFIDGYAFNNAPFMADMTNEIFNLKAEAKRKGQYALERTHKIIINSIDGFWALRTKDREGVKIFPLGEAPIQKYLKNEKLKDESDIGNYTILRVLDDLNVKDFNVSIASAITSYAR